MDEIGSLEIKWIQGFTDKNLKFVDNSTVCYSSGNHICFLNLETKVRDVFQSPGRGVAALTASSKSRIFAFSEQKLSPSVFVYSFPEQQLKNELKGEAQLDYTSLTLSDLGPYLGSCSSFPDHTITVWNWEAAEVICTQSQAGQDVISLMFNPLDWLHLCALGTRTLTVWTIDKGVSLTSLKPRVIELPVTDGSSTEKLQASHTEPNSRVPVTPAAVCWPTASELYVGCEEGLLLCVDLKSYSVSILFNPTSADASPELRKFNFRMLIWTENGVIAAGKEKVVHRLQIKRNQTSITQTWQLERPVTNALLSPDTETLLLSSNTGQIYLLNPSRSNQSVKVLDVPTGNFLAASLLHTDRNTCVSLTENGLLQLWSSDGTLLGSLPLQVEVTGLSCCPIAYYAAAGTASGSVLFVDLNMEEKPRLVHQVHLFHTAVAHVIFDQEGHYLLISGSDSHLYVINAKPSASFTVVGYIVISGCILLLSTQCFGNADKVDVLALCSDQEGKPEDGSLLTVFSLPVEDITDCADRHGCLSPQMLRLSKYKVPLPLTSCALGVGEVLAYCQRNKSLQRFQLPEVTDDPFSQQVVQIKPVQEVKHYPRGPASILLSPNCLWLASLGRDGFLHISETASMEQYTDLLCHSHRLGGGRSVFFSRDSLTLLTTGFNDGSLVCTDFRIRDVEDEKVKNAALCNDTIAHTLKIVFKGENPILINLPELGPLSPGDREQSSESEVSGGPSLDVAIKDASHSTLTWLERRRETIIKEDNEQYSEAKEHLRKNVRELYDTFQKMHRENESIPPEQFCLDVKEQRRLQDVVEQEIEKVRADIEQGIAEKCYLYDVLKRESWEPWMVKRRALKAFLSDQVIWNYPVEGRTQKELEDLRWVQNIRKFEEAAFTLHSEQKSSSAQEQQDDSHKLQTTALTESTAAHLGFSNPHVYDHLSLLTADQRVNQVILLQDLIYHIKMSFNSEFEALHSQKELELKRVRSENNQMREWMLDLDLDQELWEPEQTDSEWPERLLTVDQSEIKAEKYLPPECLEKKGRRKLEEEKHLAAKSDTKERALREMMDGVIEKQKKDIFKVEICQPEFVLTKPDADWTEEEKQRYKEHEEKIRETNQQKEKYRQSLEAEIKQLQESNQNAARKFDEALVKLFKKKFLFTAAIYQEELRVYYLMDSLFTEDQMRNQEQELKLQHERTLAHKNECCEEVNRYQREVERLREESEHLVKTNQAFEKDFKKEFKDVSHHLVDVLYKLFKHRPRVQQMRAQTENREPLPSPVQMQTAMEELDAPGNMPKGLKPSVWRRFCQMRRKKVETELKIKTTISTLAEMQAVIVKRKDKEKAFQGELEKLSEALKSLHKERNKHPLNGAVLVRLKQGQVVSPFNRTADSTGTDFILCHRSVRDSKRHTITDLATAKIASTERLQSIREQIVQLEWEHRVLNKTAEDLKDNKKDIKMFRLSKEQKEMNFCSKEEREHRMSEQIASLEKTLAKKTLQQSAQQMFKKIALLKKKAEEKAKNSLSLEQQIPDLQATLAELVNDKGTVIAADENAERNACYQETVQRSNLESLAREQAEELQFLWEEVEHLRRRNFPCFDLPKHY
ncbi:cilia- and flagella-associated protein 43 isoform X1 [Nothobranchius furzeri]|uniref:Transcript variant X1 n=2 Tax=Nothobranchius furzeri TaxID=105023 RepID=A0A9D2YI28_NOTFU|nr:transcript variant X1 [Nothobranchius furzeri]